MTLSRHGNTKKHCLFVTQCPIYRHLLQDNNSSSTVPSSTAAQQFKRRFILSVQGVRCHKMVTDTSHSLYRRKSTLTFDIEWLWIHNLKVILFGHNVARCGQTVRNKCPYCMGNKVTKMLQLKSILTFDLVELERNCEDQSLYEILNARCSQTFWAIML